MTTVAFLGTGAMGTPMVARLLRAGISVRAWNRTAERAVPLESLGAEVCPTPTDAASGAGVLVTMLADGPAVEEVAAPALRPGLLWCQMSTVGETWTTRLQELALGAGAGFVDAPVLGTVGPAQQGELTVIASGPAEQLEALRPLFAALASRVVEAGPVPAASRLKVALNLWSLTTVSAMAEVVALCERSGVDARRLLAVIAGGASDSLYARSKADLMLSRSYEPLVRLAIVRKDVELAIEQGDRHGLELLLARAVARLMSDAIEAGHGDEDLAAVFEGVRRAPG